MQTKAASPRRAQYAAISLVLATLSSTALGCTERHAGRPVAPPPLPSAPGPTPSMPSMPTEGAHGGALVQANVAYRTHGEARLPPRTRSVGINLAGTAYWSNSFPFVDAFKVADPWISGHGDTWNDGGRVATDAHGWVSALGPGQIARSFLLDEGSHHNGGQFTVLYEGRGELRYLGATTLVSHAEGRDVVEVQPRGGFWLELHSTDSHAPLRNIRVIFPGGSCSADALRSCGTDFDCQIAPDAGRCVRFEDSYEKRIFQPEFLRELAPFSVLRFMDWQETNFPRDEDRATLHGLSAWPTKASAHWHPVPLDVMLELSNTLAVDPWFTLPTQADDTFVREFAARVASTLRPESRVFVEYSNEFWNDLFGQQQWINAAGCKKFSKRATEECATGNGKLCRYTPWNAVQERCLDYGRRYFAERTVDIGAIFRSAFGDGAARVQRVMAGQIGGADWWIPSLLMANVHGKPAHTQVDVMAVAPYFGGDIERPAEVFAQRTAPANSGRGGQVDRLLFGAEGGDEDTVFRRISRDVRALSERVPEATRPRYAAYEGGQHLFSYDKSTMDTFLNLNRDPRMEGVYTRYLTLWRELTNDALFVHFTSPGQFGHYGAWGAKEYQGELPSEAPKYRALLRFVAGE